MLFHQLFDFRGHVENLPDDDPLKRIGEDNGEMFTYLVDVLRSPESFPSEPINKLMKLVWRLVGNKVVPAAVMTNIPSMHFYAEVQGGLKHGMFCVPTNWHQQCVSQRIFCMGGLIWASSQCRDFYNDKMRPKPHVMQRAWAYEAEYLLTVKKLERVSLNEYQQKVLRQFPKGLESVPHLLYSPKPFMDAS